jgi:succinate dehydrogenase hydrophobic anchor subunit
MNYWFWIYILLVPSLIFAATPKSSEKWRFIRLVGIIAITYLLINLAVNLKWDLRIDAVNSNSNATLEDLEYATADGANLIFTMLFGWIFAIVYVGWWELLWRVIHRREIRRLKLRKRFSNLVIAFSFIVSTAVAVYAALFSYPQNLQIFFHILIPPALDALHIR